MKTKMSEEDRARLISEVERLQNRLSGYDAAVNQKLELIENDLTRLEQENARLISAKEGVYVELDACVSLVVELAAANGFKVGTAPGNIVAVDLPCGQVSWDFAEAEAHLFSALPTYDSAIEDLSIQEKYRRVMNPGIRSNS